MNEPRRGPTPESKDIKRRRAGFRIVTDNPTKWLISCMLGDNEWRQSLNKATYTFRDVCTWLYDYGAVLTMQALDDTPSKIGADMQALHTDTDTKALCGQIALHVLRKAIALGSDVVTTDDVAAACCTFITRRGVVEALRVGVDRGIYLRVGEDRYVLGNENVLTERIESSGI